LAAKLVSAAQLFDRDAPAVTEPLRWYRYNGNGEPDPTGSTGWAPNSGNQIGRGWT
jgi:hypothetical protein